MVIELMRHWDPTAIVVRMFPWVTLVLWCNADHKFWRIGLRIVSLEMGYSIMITKILGVGVVLMTMYLRILKRTQTSICTNRFLILSQNCHSKTKIWRQVWFQSELKFTMTSCMLREIAWLNRYKHKQPSSLAQFYNL